MTDASLFAAGGLFTQDYLIEGIKTSTQYRSVDVKRLRSDINEILSGLPHQSKPNEATTEDDLIWPIMELLGWKSYLKQQNLSDRGRENVPDGLLFIDADTKSKANGFPQEWKRYECGAAIIEAKRWGRALDRAEGRQGDDKDTPSTQILRYLRRIDDLTSAKLRWGVLTNGAKWRLYFSGARSTIDDYLEIDLARIFGLNEDLLDTGIEPAESDHWLAVFVSMFSRTAFERQSSQAQSFHDVALENAAYYEERISKNLSALVFNQLYPELGKAVAEQTHAGTNLDEIRQATLILLYRLLFVLYAEDRGLLPVKDKRYDDYALRESRLEVGRRKDNGDTFSGVATTIWSRFSSLAEMIDKGDPSVGLPPYNGGLFNGKRTPLLQTIRLSDKVMSEALDILSFEQRDGRRQYINYRDLSVQQLGSIYERLLEFELYRDPQTGDVEVKPNLFARKNSGSYYTPDDLVLLILNETLRPLVEDAMSAFDAVLAQCKTADSESQIFAQLQKVDPAKAITRLRICDPAMGSGHFLVGLVDRLTDQALNALADAQSKVKGKFPELDYESPVSDEIRKIRTTIQGNAQDAGWTVTEEQLDDPQLVKRMVLKRCIYGADKNPMAVELAKVALWLHTFTVGAPLSFIDHHLAAGDSLFGLWVRDAMDKAGQGGQLFLHEPLSNAQRQAVAMRTIEALTDAEVAEAHKSAEMWDDVESQTGPLDSFVSFIHAIDWLDLKQPVEKAAIRALLDGLFGDPIAIVRGRTPPNLTAGGAGQKLKNQKFDSKDLISALGRILDSAKALIGDERFLNWQITFPGVWSNWSSAGRDGGFDAIVGNPPWAKVELEASKWFTNRNEAIVLAANNTEREALIAALEQDDPTLYQDYHAAKSRFSQSAEVARESGLYPLFGRGRPNLYQLFFEQALRLIKPSGLVGFLVPSGIISDRVSSSFVRSVAPDNRILTFWDFENRRPEGGRFFPDVDGRFKVAITIIGGQHRRSEHIDAAFFLPSIERQVIASKSIRLSSSLFEQFNPGTGTAIIFRDDRDAKITASIYERIPVMHAPETKSTWDITFNQMLNQSTDSGLFRDEKWLKSDGWYLSDLNRWKKGEAVALPLYEGKMVQAYDHRAADIVLNVENRRRAAQPVPIDLTGHQDPERFPKPRAFIAKTDLPENAQREWMIGYKDTTATTNVRTMIASILPASGSVHALPVLLPSEDASKADFPLHAASILANLNCICFDYLARQKVQTTHFSWYIVEQLPVICRESYNRSFGSTNALEIIRETVLELVYTSTDMAEFAKDLGHIADDGTPLQPFAWDEERRLHLRSKLDALYFILYGIFDPADPVQSRDNIEYIFSTFPIVERQDILRWERYRSRDLTLAYINALVAGAPDALVKG